MHAKNFCCEAYGRLELPAKLQNSRTIPSLHIVWFYPTVKTIIGNGGLYDNIKRNDNPLGARRRQLSCVGVHDKGSVLFYKFYQESDLETMEKTVRCFSQLIVKNTRNFLRRLRLIGLAKVADLIERGLTE